MDVHAWFERHLPEEAGRLRRSLGNLSDPPFAAPVHWAPFMATGEF
jgi:hypothetical protein